MVNINKQEFPCGLLYRVCKFLDKYDYPWEFRDSKFYGPPYDVDPKVFYEGVELFMNRISNVPPRPYIRY